MRVGVPTRYHLLRVPSTSSARRASPPAHTRVSHARGGGALPTGALQRRGGAGGDGAVRDGRRGGRRGGGRAATGRASSGGRARGQGARGPQRRRRQEVRTDTTPHEFVVLRTALRCSPLSVRRSPHLIEDHGERWFEGAVSEVGGGWDRRVMVAGFTNRTLARVRGLHQSVSQGAARVSTHLAAGLTNVRLPAPSSPAAADTAARLPLAPLARWRVCGRPSTRHRCLSEHPAESPPDTHTSGLMSHAQHSVQPHAHHAPRVRGLTVAACGRSLWDRRSTARVRAGQTTRRRRTRLRRSPLRR